MINEIYEDRGEMDISRSSSDYLEDDIYVGDDGSENAHPAALIQDRNGVAWREIEKYRERKALESFLKDDLYDDLDIYTILD
jgi:hypothetical protein